MRQTKIVCTIGPASESSETIRELIKAGMNVARLNFSHGTHEEHECRINTIRKAAEDLGVTVAILLDTKGPEIRTGKIAHPVELVAGQKFILTSQDILSDAKRVTVTYPNLSTEVREGTEILLSDGLLKLKVLATNQTETICEVINGGTLKSQQGINIPGAKLDLPALTDKDIADINLGIKLGVDFIAASFIRKAEDVLEIRRILELWEAEIDIIAKIESLEGVTNFDSILAVSDGIMVARGDLGVEIPAEEVPLVQKKIIEKCNQVGKPVITATQMLESMTQNPRPTRAEASDVANAVLDGTDALMLSGETAAGNFPIEAVKTMVKIANRTEEAFDYHKRFNCSPPSHLDKTTNAICYSTSLVAETLDAAAIITLTESGSTARMVAKYRPTSPIIAVSSDQTVKRKLTIVRGVHPIGMQKVDGTDAMINSAINSALEEELVQIGDLVVITAGVPVGVPGTTNLLKVHVIGEIVAKGQGIGKGSKTGIVRLVRTPEEALAKIKGEDDILVTHSTDRDYIPALEKAGAILTAADGITSHAAIVGLNLSMPTIVGLGDDIDGLEEGMTITIDASRGVIYRGTSRIL